MSDTNSSGTHEVAGTTELENALITVERKLDETFEAAERQALADEEAGAGLVLEQVLDLIYDTFGSVIPYDRIGVATVEDDGKIVRSRWARSEADSLTMGTGYAAPLEDEAVQTILGSGEPLMVNDLEAYLEEHPGSQATRDIIEDGMRSSLTCPLASGGKPTGMMVFSSAERNVYTDKHRGIFKHIAAHIAAILERSRMFEKLIELNWQLRVASDALKYQASHDGLTKLWNRTAILEIIDREMARAHRQKKPMTIVMCDIDNFKGINDTHGHAIGDVVLQAVAGRLAETLSHVRKRRPLRRRGILDRPVRLRRRRRAPRDGTAAPRCERRNGRNRQGCGVSDDQPGRRGQRHLRRRPRRAHPRRRRGPLRRQGRGPQLSTSCAS